MSVGSVNSISYGSMPIKNNSTSTKPEKKEGITSNKAVQLTTSLLGLAAIGIYIVTRGKSKIKTSSSQADISKNIKNVVDSYTAKYKAKLSNIEAKVTTLKNNKTKIEFQTGENSKHILICDKNGNFEKRIVFKNDNNAKSYNIYKSFDYSMNDELKSYTSTSSFKNINGNNIKFNKIDIRKYEPGKTWQKEINTTKSDQYLFVDNGMEYIPSKGGRGVGIKTYASLNNKPTLVYQRLINNQGSSIGSYTYTPSENIIKTATKINPFIKDKNFELFEDSII